MNRLVVALIALSLAGILALIGATAARSAPLRDELTGAAAWAAASDLCRLPGAKPVVIAAVNGIAKKYGISPSVVARTVIAYEAPLIATLRANGSEAEFCNGMLKLLKKYGKGNAPNDEEEPA
jgi:hypothetical protein